MWQGQYKGIDDWELREPEDSYGNMALGTTAKDGKDGDQEAFAEKETQIIDTVVYKGLIAGESYWLVGTLMDKEIEKESYNERNILKISSADDCYRKWSWRI